MYHVISGRWSDVSNIECFCLQVHYAIFLCLNAKHIPIDLNEAGFLNQTIPEMMPKENL